jgi:hypothetical protein
MITRRLPYSHLESQASEQKRLLPALDPLAMLIGQALADGDPPAPVLTLESDLTVLLSGVPDSVIRSITDLLTACWDLDPASRPTCLLLAHSIQSILVALDSND